MLKEIRPLVEMERLEAALATWLPRLSVKQRQQLTELVNELEMFPFELACGDITARLTGLDYQQIPAHSLVTMYLVNFLFAYVVARRHVAYIHTDGMFAYFMLYALSDLLLDETDSLAHRTFIHCCLHGLPFVGPKTKMMRLGEKYFRAVLANCPVHRRKQVIQAFTVELAANKQQRQGGLSLQKYYDLSAHKGASCFAVVMALHDLDIDAEESSFCAALQFLDDLRDIAVDQAEGIHTYATELVVQRGNADDAAIDLVLLLQELPGAFNITKIMAYANLAWTIVHTPFFSAELKAIAAPYCPLPASCDVEKILAVKLRAYIETQDIRRRVPKCPFSSAYLA